MYGLARPLLQGGSKDDAANTNVQRKKRPPKRFKKSYDAAEESFLENLVFGVRGELVSKLDRVDLVTVDTTKSVREGEDMPNDMFLVDRTGDDRNAAFALDTVGETSRTDQIELDNHQSLDAFEDGDGDRGQQKEEKKPAWEDEDDDIDAIEGFEGCRQLPKKVESDQKYKQYLERRFTEIYEPPSWAQKALEKKDKKSRRDLSESESDSEEDDIDRTARDYIKQKKGLRRDFLQIKKCSHLNQASRVKTSCECVHFHPNATVALLGSQIGLVRLFQVDGKANSMIQSIYFRGYRLCDAKFISAAGREEIIVGSDGSNLKSIGFCYYYDMVAGKVIRIKLEKSCRVRYSLRGFEISPNGQLLAACDQNGHINLLSTSSKEHVGELKMNGEVDTLAFSADSNYLLAHGRENACQAYIFDIRNARSSLPCVNRFNDLGTIEATSLAVSATGNLVAIGSNMGVVNLYNFDDVFKKRDPEPLRAYMNLTTAITSLRFNHDGQLLLMASSEKNDAIRFANTTSGTVYPNFPLFVGTNNRTYGRINHVDISPNSGYAAFASGNGTGHLFRINEYSTY